eukprot:3761193-Pleurochrysis_carterae.AAC.4
MHGWQPGVYTAFGVALGECPVEPHGGSDRKKSLDALIENLSQLGRLVVAVVALSAPPGTLLRLSPLSVRGVAPTGMSRPATRQSIAQPTGVGHAIVRHASSVHATFV